MLLSLLINSLWTTVHVFWGPSFMQKVVLVHICYLYDENNDKIYCLKMKISVPLSPISVLCVWYTVNQNGVNQEWPHRVTHSLKLILVLMIYGFNFYLKKKVWTTCVVDCWSSWILRGLFQEKTQTCGIHVSLKWCSKNYFLN